MNRITFLSQRLHEPAPVKPGAYSLAHHAERALGVAEHVLGVEAPPIGTRDTRCVRGLAAHLLHDSGRWSWPDVCEVLYGHRHGHATALDGAAKWRGTVTGQLALSNFKGFT